MRGGTTGCTEGERDREREREKEREGEGTVGYKKGERWRQRGERGTME